MTSPAVDPASPAGKALDASHMADVRRLRAGAEALRAVLPSHGVLFDRTLRRKGAAPVRVQFVWPGVLKVLSLTDGALIRGAMAAHMLQDMPRAAIFMDRQTGGRPLRCVTFQPPQSLRMRASISADGVLRVRAARTGELLAESMPGQPHALRPGFRTLKAQDLAPRLD